MRKGCSEGLKHFPKAVAVWDRNIYIDLNGNRQNLGTKQIKSHVFSYTFLTSIVICVLDIFYDTLGSTGTI